MLRQKINVALIGYGYWGPNLLRNLKNRPECNVAYVCDRSAEQLSNVSDHYPEQPVTQDFNQVVGDPDVDALVIATPISTHYHLAMRAIEAGKHVLVEKPLTDSVQDAKAMVQAAAKRRLVLMVGHTFLFSPPVRKIKEIIDSGDLGDIYYVTTSRVNPGLHQNDASVVSDVDVIWDLAPHDIAMLLYWLGEEPDTVHACGRGCMRADVPDVAFINAGFPSGAIAEIHLSWLSPVKIRRTMIVGGKKVIIYDDTESIEKVRVFEHGAEFRENESFGEFLWSYRTGDVYAPRLENYEPLAVEIKHFLDCILSGANPITDGYSGLQVVRALEMANKSLLRSNNYIQEVS